MAKPSDKRHGGVMAENPGCWYNVEGCLRGIAMADLTLTLTLPEPVYRVLSERAARRGRTVETEAAEYLGTAPPPDAHEDGVPDLDALLAPFRPLPEEELLRLLGSSLSKDEQERVAALNRKAAATGLSAEERVEQDRLVALYEQKVLLRGQAMATLRERGYPLADLLAKP